MTSSGTDLARCRTMPLKFLCVIAGRLSPIFVRLQFSQNATLNDVPETERQNLRRGGSKE